MFNNILKEHVQLLNEQYYGKNSKTLEIERVFKEMKNEIKTDKLENLNSSRCLFYAKQLEQCLRELFNFKQAIVSIENIGSMNAYTYAKSLEDAFTGPLTYKEVNKKYGGIQYTDKANRALQVVISLEIIRRDDVTPQILTGILLHEIGHNFFIEDNLVFRMDSFLVGLFTFGRMSNVFKNWSNILEDVFRDNPLNLCLNNINSILARFRGYVQSILIVTSHLAAISNPVCWLPNLNIVRNCLKMLNPVGAMVNLNNYSNELFADNFATSYGYGPELAEFSRIFTTDSTGFELLDSFNKKSKLSKSICDMSLTFFDVFNSVDIFKSRASEVTRVYDQLNYLKTNLNGVKDQKQRECIKNDILAIEKSLKKFEETIDNSPELAYTKSATDLAFKNKGELAYKIRKRKYDDNGNWKNLI